MKIAILIPTYNESGNVKLLIKKISLATNSYNDIRFSVYIIDDNSPDKTSEIVLAISKKINRLFFKVNLLSKSKKEGLGKAYLFGFNYLLKNKSYDYILQMDADLSHNPENIKDFLRASLDGYDFVVGSRYVKGGSLPKNWPWYRRYLSIFGNLYSQLILGKIISDYTGGFNMYSIKLIKKIDFTSLDVSGYGFLIGLKFYASQKAHKIIQIPIHFNDRSWGNSKMPLNTLLRNFIYVLKLKLNA